MKEPFTLTQNASLDTRTTFRVPARAAWLADVKESAALPELLTLPQQMGKPVLVLGSGSNVLFTSHFDGLVIHLDTRGIEVLSDDGAEVIVRAAAGEDWDSFVRWSLLQGFSGLENLVLIPGTVGAAPIQNIGAYGTEVSEFVEAVQALDRETGDVIRSSQRSCDFSYRSSIFKRHPDRYIVTAVELRLFRERPLSLEYTGVRQELASMGIDKPTPHDVCRAVERLRQRKLPDHNLIGNAGSFFKNPAVTVEHAHGLQRDNPGLPLYPCSNGHQKIPAAWLIESCGFKGFREGDAGVSDLHALVLVNHGAATGAQLWALAQRIRAAVQDRFGVVLEPEPLII